MANNFFGKLRGLVSTAWSEADIQPTHYTTPAPAVTHHAGTPSKVEQYLARQAAAQAASAPKALTGVEKYLAKQAGAAPAAQVTKGELTSVDKYLAKQAGGTPAKTPAAKPAAPLSKVDKYLASQNAQPKEKEKAPAPAKKTDEATKSAPAPKKKNKVVDVTPTEKLVKKAAPVTAKEETPAVTPVEVTDLSAGATQCQANTTKGTQCRNTLRLNQLQQTINNKAYIFAACNQHNNDTFKPFQPV